MPISIDTYKADVASRALAAGAAIVNDVSALRYDPALAAVVARDRRRAGADAQPRPVARRCTRRRTTARCVDEVAGELAERVTAAVAAGVARERVIVDPGIGFAKQAEHSLEMLARLPELARLDRPLLVGPSRKSFLQDRRSAIARRATASGARRRPWPPP